EAETLDECREPSSARAGERIEDRRHIFVSSRRTGEPHEPPHERDALARRMRVLSSAETTGASSRRVESCAAVLAVRRLTSGLRRQIIETSLGFGSRRFRRVEEPRRPWLLGLE